MAQEVEVVRQSFLREGIKKRSGSRQKNRFVNFWHTELPIRMPQPRPAPLPPEVFNPNTKRGPNIVIGSVLVAWSEETGFGKLQGDAGCFGEASDHIIIACLGGIPLLQTLYRINMRPEASPYEEVPEMLSVPSEFESTPAIRNAWKLVWPEWGKRIHAAETQWLAEELLHTSQTNEQDIPSPPAAIVMAAHESI